MKIVHLTVLRQLTPGITKQLRFEHDAARKLEDVQWTTIVYHDSPAIESYMRQTPYEFFEKLTGVDVRKIMGYALIT